MIEIQGDTPIYLSKQMVAPPSLLPLHCLYTIWRETLAGGTLANWLILSIWRKKVWQINRSANRLLMISTNLDGFSLANHGRFAKFANVSPCQSVPPYSNMILPMHYIKQPHPPYWTAPIAMIGTTDNRTAVSRALSQNIRISDRMICRRYLTNMEMFT